MSEVSTPVTEEFFRYLAERTTQEDSFLHDLKTGVHAESIPPIWTSPEQGQLQINITDGHPLQGNCRRLQSCRVLSGLDRAGFVAGRSLTHRWHIFPACGPGKQRSGSLLYGEAGW